MWLRFFVFASCTFVVRCQMEQFTNFVNDGLNISKIEGKSRCEDQLLRYFEGLKNGSNWAIKMADATAKFQSGFLKGNLIELGTFDECMEIVDPDSDIEGQYCLSRMQYKTFESAVELLGYKVPGNEVIEMIADLPLFSIIWGQCVPSGCSAKELTELTSEKLNFTNILCQTKSSWPKMSIADYNAIFFLAFIFLLIFLSTTYDLYLNHVQQKPASKFLLSFSFLTNGRRLLQTTNNPTQLNFICGIRTITMMWILMGHMYSSAYIFPLSNLLDVGKFLMSEKSMFLLGATVSVDTFFLLSGIFTTYTFLIYQKRGLKFDVLDYYVHRYLRLTPSLAVLVFLTATLMKHASSGPLWPIGSSFMCGACEKNWWSTLSYTQNIFTMTEPCVPVTWYLSVDMQLFLISPLILIPMKKHMKATLAVVALLACMSIASAYYIAYKYELHALLNEITPQGATYITKYYAATIPRSAPWFIGVIMGYVLFQAKFVYKDLKIDRKLVVLMWALSLTVLTVCVFCGHDLLLDKRDNVALNRAYVAFLRPSWAIALSWVVFACTTGYGGVIDAFLSLPVFQVIAKLSYSMYLLHLTVLTMIVMSSKQSFRFSNTSAMYYYWAHLSVILMASAIWTLSFESPFAFIQDLLRAKGRKTKDGANKVLTEKPEKMPASMTEKPPKDNGKPV